MKKIKIQGVNLNTQDSINPPFEGNASINLKKSVAVSNVRGVSTTVEIECEEDDIANVVFDDGGEWFGSVKDIPEIFQMSSNRSATSVEIEIPAFLNSGGQRGIGSIATKFFNLFTVEKLAKEVAEQIGIKFDEKIMPDEGLFAIDSAFELKEPKFTSQGSQHYLLFIHGTASSTDGSFEGLFEERDIGIWDKIQSKYGANILALQHKTVSVDPFENALAVLENIPAQSTLDIVSHSRGGLVADILARYDERNEIIGFTEFEVDILTNEQKVPLKTLERLSKLANRKKIEVLKMVRVACPAKGTTLMSSRLDHYLNGLLRAIGMAFGIVGNPIYEHVKTFLLEVIKSRKTPESFAGLSVMVPDGPFQKVINNAQQHVESDLLVVEGNAEIGGGVKHSILVIFSNLFYWKANDFVVNTDSMRYGVVRRSGTYIFLSQTKQTSHFNYFKNANTQSAIYNALYWIDDELPKGFQFISHADGRRGDSRGMLEYGDVVVKEPSGNKPIVILIPGIMGSNLSVANDKIWIDFMNIYKGRMIKQLTGDEVTATSIVGKFYQQMVTRLEDDGYEVRVFPFDWRRSLDIAAEALQKLIKQYRDDHKQVIKIVAHSMGGLVVRNLIMRDTKGFWDEYINDPGSMFLMLGTPWRGSYAIMEVLTGFSRRIKQLALLDFKHNLADWLKLIQDYEGVYELLPIDEIDFEKESFWSNISSEISRKKFSPPNKVQLEKFKKYKSAVLKYVNGLEKNGNEKLLNTYYIAGFKKSTTEDFAISDSLFGKSLNFISTPEGDGSVTWELGIPQAVDPQNIYYTRTEHGELANDSDLFPGILEILKKGRTNHFMKSAPSVAYGLRGEGQSDIGSYLDHTDPFDIIFGVDGEHDSIDSGGETIVVQVTHAHLRAASYPVMVGHFLQDGIVSAEKALDWALDNRLEERRMLGKYPGEIGDSLILYDVHSNPNGAIVVGLGDNDKMTAYNLTRTVEQGVIDYVLHIRDNVEVNQESGRFDGISSLCIGSGFGRLPLENALSAILQGVRRANEKLVLSGSDYTTIKHVEFIEIYANVARNAYYSLKRIAKQETSLQIDVRPAINEKFGGRKKLEYVQDPNWWHQFTTEKIKAKKKGKGLTSLRFSSSSGIARIESRDNFASEKLVNTILKEMSQSNVWDKELSKTIFELVIPNGFKEVIRNQSNILWKLDVNTAAFPWEMFHDFTFDPKPTFTSAGLIRQLVTKTYRENAEIVKNKMALIIGDPIYKNMPQLPSAKKEAETINEALKLAGYETNPQVGKGTVVLMKAIFATEFKILHVSGHGVVDKDPKKTGIVLGENIFTPQDLKQLSKVPEFVFINCCHSGAMNSNREELYEERYRFAANIGTQLISMGVSAAVVTGWAVDDGAAEYFAKTFYAMMLNGYGFGEAVRIARQNTYNYKSNDTTWAAYQCYGDPWYKFDRKISPKPTNGEFIAIDEVLVELDNVIVDIRKVHRSKVDDVIKRTQHIIEMAKQADLDDEAEIIEKQAQIYMEVDEIDLALPKYEYLMTKNRATYSVRSLEQYCNLLAKHYVRQDKPSSKHRDHMLAQFNSLLLIGTTAERLCLYGSAYKRVAQKATTSREREKRLTEMSDKYESAFTRLTAEGPKQYTYPLCNWLMANKFLNREGSVLYHGRQHKPITILNKVEGKLRKLISDHVDFWENIALVNVLMCKMLYDTTNIETLRDEIIRTYKEAWNIDGNYRNLRTEIEHLEFMTAMINHDDSMKSIQQAIDEIHEDLTNIMNAK